MYEPENASTERPDHKTGQRYRDRDLQRKDTEKVRKGGKGRKESMLGTSRVDVPKKMIGVTMSETAVVAIEVALFIKGGLCFHVVYDLLFPYSILL